MIKDIPPIVYYFMLVELLAVSWGDIKTKKIPNVYSILNLIVFAILLFMFESHYFFVWQTFIYSFIFLGVTFVFFLLGIMGGGDAKFLFTYFLIVPFGMQDEAFNFLLLSTIGVGTSFLIMNIYKSRVGIKKALNEREFEDLRKYFGTKFSFAPVILCSWIVIGWKLGLFF
jgi:prepilin peptidase CpaA